MREKLPTVFVSNLIDDIDAGAIEVIEDVRSRLLSY
jgi:hypothetical protein